MKQTTQYKQTSIGTIPEDWEIKKIREIGEVSSGGTPDTANPNFWNGNINWCTPTDISKLQNRYLGHTITKISDEGLKKSSAKILPPHSIIVCTRATIGKAAINTVPMTTNQGFKNVIPTGVDNEFLYYKIISEEHRLVRIASGSTFLEVSKTDFDNFQIALPPLCEQQKIAEILSTWDNAIDTCKKIIKKLKKRNKGLAQQLLTGKTRVKGFEGSKWEYVAMSKMFIRTQEKNLSDIEEYEVLTISGKLGFVSQNVKFNKVIAGNSLKNYTLLKKGEFSYNKGNSKTYQYGCVFRLDEFEKALVPNVYISFKAINEIDTTFYSYYFKQDLLKPNLAKIISSGARMDGLLNVNPNDFFSIKVSLPPFEEQKLIANILDNANEELTKYEQKLANLQLQKKGLMQQLLTGKVRTV